MKVMCVTCYLWPKLLHRFQDQGRKWAQTQTDAIYLVPERYFIEVIPVVFVIVVPKKDTRRNGFPNQHYIDFLYYIIFLRGM